MKYENEKKIFYDTTLILTWPLMASVWPFWPLDIVLDIKSSVGNSNLKNFSKVKKKDFRNIQDWNLETLIQLPIT